jgi:Holliday junction resolvasome RuvABC ATP-dependent DNA helicase subunit
MQINETFEECVGQESVKKTLSLYIDAYKETNRLPFLNLTTQKGGGKTFFARKFREALKRKDGTRPPMLEINGKTIRSVDQFFEQVYPVWVANDAFLFIDEGHNLPQALQQVFLTILNVDKNPNRTIELNGVPYDFNFEKISFAMATTDQQKLSEPLRDRLRDISFEDYKPSELFEIFENNLEYKIEISQEVKDEIISTFRGNPRDVVVKAEDLKTFSAAEKHKTVDSSVWQSFCSVMGVNPLGLSNAELSIVKILGKRGESTLTNLASITGFDRSAIQKDYESILVRKNLMEIDVKRKLTADGIRFFRTLVKN